MGISRQAHYKALACQRQQCEQEAKVIEMVRHTRQRQPRVGTRKLHHMLQEPMQQAGIKLGRDGLFDLLRDACMLVAPKRAYHKTTHSHHHLRRHPNLLKAGVAGQVVPSRCEQVWVADITYLPTRDKTVYLSLVTDAYSRKIVGWHVHASLQAEEVSQALKMALRGRQTRQPLVHHSDRGVQYCSSHYQSIHSRHRITCSMTDGHDCYQNALAERINGILKTEFLLHRPTDLQQAARMVRESIAVYNRERPHDSLKKQTPEAVHRASLASQQERQFMPA
jgi:putative transposase